MAQRLEALTIWLRSILQEGVLRGRRLGKTAEAPRSDDFQISPASADASFRRYFRVTNFGLAGQSLIVMDAPPDKEDIHPFVKVATILAEAGLNVPQIFAKDLEQGFLLLSDLGNQAYLDALNSHTVDQLYADALDALLVMQRDASKQGRQLPVYDAALLLSEMALFRDWYCQQYRQQSFSAQTQAELAATFQLLAEAALAQPQVFVHRDYHSRNLMVTPEHNPGILDFQDAVIGPVTYDLVSLLRDCYIDWPRPRIEQWALAYLHRAADLGLIPHESDDTYLRWFDWMGVQRHLKAAGIFARLHLRDNKPGYLGDIPRTLAYVREVSARYAELSGLHRLLGEIGD